MKIGDMVRVRYETDGEWYHGIIITSPDDDPLAVWRMWCFERQNAHILVPDRDTIEILSEK